MVEATSYWTGSSTSRTTGVGKVCVCVLTEIEEGRGGKVEPLSATGWKLEELNT